MIRTLYVDDEPGLLEIAKLFLETDGDFSVTTVISATAAMPVLDREEYDAVISDYQMPEMDGLAFLKAVRASGNAIPFILFTGRGREEVVIQAINNGADFYIQKGGDVKAQFAELAHKIRQAVSRKKAELALRQSEEKFRSLIETSPDMIWEIDLKGNFRYISPQIKPVLGFGAEELIGKPVLILIPEHARQFVGQEIGRHAASDSGLFTIEVPARHKDGRDLTIEIRSGRVVDAAGNLTALRGVARDITERKRAEAGLKKSELFTRALLEAVPTPVFYKDRDGKYRGCNRAFTEITGTKPEDLVGKTVFDLWPAELARIYHEKDMDLIQHPEHQVYEYRITDREGKIRPVIYAKDVFTDDSGTVAGIVGAFLDITDRVTAETAMAASEGRFRTIFDTAQVGMVLIDPASHQILQVNKKALDLLGAAEADVIGKVCHSFICPAEAGQCPVTDCGQEMDASERVLVKTDGSRIPILKTVAPMRLGERTILLESFVDLSERKRIEEERLKASSMLEALLDAIPDVIGVQDPAHGMIRYNEAGYVMLGQTPEGVSGKRCFEMIGHDAPCDICATSETYRTKRPAKVEKYVPELGKWLDVRSYPVLDSAGEIRFVIEHLRDITVQKCAEQELQKRNENLAAANEQLAASEEELRQQYGELAQLQERLQKNRQQLEEIAGNIPGVAYQFFARNDGAMELHYLSQRAAEIFGFPDNAGEFIPWFFEHVDERDRVAFHSSIDWSVKEVLPWNFEGRFVRPSGDQIWFQGISHPVRREGGLIFNGILLDVTGRKNMEVALWEVNNKLNLLSSVTRHDIHNKVTVQLGLLALARQKVKDSPEMAEFIRKLESAAKAIAAQVEFTRVYQDMGSHEPQWQNLLQVITKIPVPPDLSVSFDCVGIELFSDLMVGRVFANLIENSIRHGENVTRISLSATRAAGGPLVLCFEDNGAGICENEKDRIFECGFGKNTGLGLFLSREILALTGITIRETGEPGKGARFEITVPEGAYRFADSR